MNKEKFKKLIKSIGFKDNGCLYKYEYKDFEIYLYDIFYDFHNGSGWIDNIPLNDLAPELKRLIRSIKLKQLLR